MANPMIQLIVLAAIAVFLILRLRGVLGTRDGFEPNPADAAPVERDFKVIDHEPGAVQEDELADHVDRESAAYRALSAMKQVDPSFALGPFLTGAKQAYEMILMAFENGDLSDVRPFLAPEVAAVFDQVIEQRRAAGQTVEAQFLGTRETSLTAATFDPSTNEAELTVRFVGEMIAATRDADGTVVDGDPKKSRKQRDHWTFARVMDSVDPNWRLVATGA